MGVNIIDVATSAMRSVNKAIATISGINLIEMPTISREELTSLSILPPPGTFTSVVRFDQKNVKWAKGALILYISPSSTGLLFKQVYGIDSQSSEEEIKDACGEFCNVLAGGFKKEISNLNYGELEISTPTNYFESIQGYFGSLHETIEFAVSHKYCLKFRHHENELLIIDVAMESAT